MRRTWKQNRRGMVDANRDLNVAAMSEAGFSPDPGKILTAEEIASINLTPPDKIRDCRANPQHIFWR